MQAAPVGLRILPAGIVVADARGRVHCWAGNTYHSAKSGGGIERLCALGEDRVVTLGDRQQLHLWRMPEVQALGQDAQAGHHVLYCFGEGRREDITRELSRLQASLGYEELRYGEERRVPLVLDKYARAAGDLAALPGRLAVYDEEFDGQTVRDLARRYRRALSQAQAAGEAGEHARLIVVIDNIDSAVTFDNKRFSREDQAYEYEAKRFEQAAKRDSYHLAVLSQTNDEGRRRQGAPEKSDIARAKVLMNRAAFVVTLHRPITEADRTQTDKDGEPGRRARTWIAVRKARGGRVDELEFATNPRTGQWFDPQQAAF
ncbi:DnaB-like helicase C-terminal domain-containing protein [Deinococcus reticulitermitis]|uniref:DnaB-like helicase C-terminal domain-containing protein n=1 Tax=Deinococcus reticulitermitis TaxID=856736 RepID=UPI0015A64729|nr:DnaB-like helicase C-terminal domain-containing protein [Deinococcus reticulitermitis]